ncbi:hypothetical protein PUN28_013671 [Cardiocondyla obscurior]|uniref:Uncharacterized protein n=1 Tax=Cardiocondyla obscurior TaxID=286306 RepID=A0AAW2F6R4_9HYME
MAPDGPLITATPASPPPRAPPPSPPAPPKTAIPAPPNPPSPAPIENYIINGEFKHSIQVRNKLIKKKF